MDLRELLAVLRYRWLPIVLLTVLGGGAAYGFTSTEQPLYTAQATVLIQSSSGRTAADLNDGAVFVARVVTTYSTLTRTPVVLNPVASKLGFASEAELGRAVTASITSGTTFLTVKGTWQSPERAAQIANAVADQLKVAIESLAPTQAGVPSLVVSTITPASAPSSPSSPNLTANLAIGILAGFIVGLGYVLLVNALNTRVRAAADIRKVTSARVLGTIAKPRRQAKSAIALSNPWIEDYRRVRTNLRLLDADERPGAIVVTSCTGHEGMLAVAQNVARTAVEGGLRVALVEADLRQPTLAGALELGAVDGVGEILTGRAKVNDTVRKVDGVDVIVAGALVRRAGDLVTSSRMSDLLNDLRERYELVVLAAPPLLSVTDAAALGAGVDGVVLVVGRPRVTREQVSEAVEALRMAGAELLGVVLNDVAHEQEGTGATATARKAAGPRFSPKRLRRGMFGGVALAVPGPAMPARESSRGASEAPPTLFDGLADEAVDDVPAMRHID